MTKFSINCGHTTAGAGTGAAYKEFNESEITRAVGQELISILKRKGHTVYNSTIDEAKSQNDYLKKAVEKVNNTDADIAISLHCNASALHTGKGVEVWTWNGKKHKEAINILEEFEYRGFKNRGIKKGNSLYFIKHTESKSILVEMFFLDNKTDRELYNKYGHKELARMIYRGLIA